MIKKSSTSKLQSATLFKKVIGANSKSLLGSY